MRTKEYKDPVSGTESGIIIIAHGLFRCLKNLPLGPADFAERATLSKQTQLQFIAGALL